MSFDNYNLEVISPDGLKYSFNNLSDGEKAIFYYIAHVLFTKPNSYIIVDEPENHLHSSICNKLWDLLETERKDCSFIYITHNIDFALSRNNKTILWNKKFTPPVYWDFERLPSSSEIPEKLMLELLGSKRDILFCEGDDRNSFDFKLYEVLFPNYTIKPVDGHLNVINYCKVYNRNKELYGRTAIGIVDGDCCYIKEQIDAWKKENIYVLPVNEIENVLCDQLVLEKAIIRFISNQNALQEYMDCFFREMDDKVEYQATVYTRDRINKYLMSHLLEEKKGKKENLIKEYEKLINENLIENFYSEREAEIKFAISKRDYDEALKVCNLKKHLIGYIATTIDKEYQRKIIPMISEDIELQSQLKTKYFNWDKLIESE